jgi:hypothetical protein
MRVARTLTLAGLVMAAALGLGAGQQSASGWQVETVDDYHVGKFIGLAIDSSGQPHLSYYDEANGNVKYATKTATAGWVSEVVALAGSTTPLSIAVYTTIAVDSSGNPQIAYFDDNTNQLKYARKSGTAWTVETIDAGCGSACALNGSDPSLALDSFDNPHVSYYGSAGGTSNGYLRYAYKSGGSWHSETVDSDGDAGFETTIAIDRSGEPHIAYVRYPETRWRLANRGGRRFWPCDLPVACSERGG